METTSSMLANQDDSIEEIIDKLSTNATEELEPTYTRKLKAYCRKLPNETQEQALNHIGKLVLHQLSKNHAQIRYGSFLIIEYLFERAHYFRLFICDHLDILFKLCLGIYGYNKFVFYAENKETDDPIKRKKGSAHEKVIQPVVWAKKLRFKAVECFNYWNNEFGNAYKKLKSAYSFLEKHGELKLESTPIASSSSASNLDESFSQNFQIDKFFRDFEDIENDVNLLIIQINTCFDLLIPVFKVFEKNDEVDHFVFRPMQGLSFSIILNTTVGITRDSSNTDIIDNLQDLCNEINKIYNSRLSQYEKSLFDLKLSLHTEKVSELIEKTKILKIKIRTIVCKFDEIHIVSPAKTCEESASSSNNLVDDGEEDEFEEVPALREDVFLMRRMAQEKSTKMPLPNSPSINMPMAKLPQFDDQCKALLPSGRLCPRRDKLKCPFHGKIIPRADDGLPIDATLRAKALQDKFDQEANQWKDSNYLKALSEKTGIDLTEKSFTSKRGKKKYPNLIDLKKLHNTPRQRLMRKVTTKKTREKVVADLNALDERVHLQYTEQWSYALQN